MSERPTIGQILTSVGRISEGDVATALEYQRENGGYFGAALLASGLLSQEELDWGLASQFDIPYVFPDAESVDLEAASLVSPEWAMANLTLPILRTQTSLKIVIDSPMRTESVEELTRQTGLEAEVALASPSAIRDLIRQVFAMASAIDQEPMSPVELAEALDIVLLEESARFGISVRGTRANVWWDEKGAIRRARLVGDWRAELGRMLLPAPAEVTEDTARAGWDAEFNRGESIFAVHVDYIADESGREYLFKPRPKGVPLKERFPLPEDGIVSEVRSLARSGTARFIVVTSPPELGHEILPHLPTILLDRSWRSIYINAQEQSGAEEAFSVQMPADPATWSAEIETLRAFHFDVVTVDLSGGDSAWAERSLDIASVAFLLWSAEDDTRPAFDAGIRWQLRIEKTVDKRLEWSLEPLYI
ncbi:MAG: GspE/PulE/PilB domain-containing protein [Longimicrobiales bacterium]